MSPRCLMIAPACFPPATPESIVNAKLALALKRSGWDIDVLTSPGKFESWYPAETEVWRELSGCVHFVQERPATRIRSATAMLAGLLSHGQVHQHRWRWALPAIGAARALCRQKSYDLILSRSTPDAAHLAALVIHRKTHLPWIANWNDPDPFVRYPHPYAQGPDAPLGFFTRRFYAAVAREAAWHTFPCERLGAYMARQWPAIASKCSAIPHVAMPDASPPPQATAEFRVCYAGSVRAPRDPAGLIQAAREFAQRRNLPGPLLRFMVDQPERVTAAAQQAGATALVQIDPARPYVEMPGILAKQSVLVVIEPALDEGIFLPSKVVDYVQIGRPILAVSPRVGTLNDLLSAHGGGIAADCRDTRAIVAALDRFYEEWQQGRLEATYGSSRLMDMFHPQRVVDLYGQLLRRLGDPPPAP